MGLYTNEPGSNGRGEISRTLGALYRNGDVLELRAFVKERNYKNTYAGWFDDFEELKENAVELEGKKGEVYITVNPVDPRLLGRSENKVTKVDPASTPSTSDKEVLRRRWIFIDCDPVRPSKISATEEEKRASFERMDEVLIFLRGKGIDGVVTADSGNGAHALLPVDLPNDRESRELVGAFLEALDFRFSDDRVNIDTTASNAARLTKLYGVTARKGEDSTKLGRVHRPSSLISVPEDMALISTSAIRVVADETPEVKRPRKDSSGDFDLASWVKENDVPVKREGPWGNGGRRYILEECIWNGHTDDSAYIVQGADGWIAAGCQHDSCKLPGGKNRWREVKQFYEPAEHRHRHRHHYSGGDGDGTLYSSIAFADIEEPDSPEEVWEGMIVKEWPALLFGGTGVTKTVLAAAIGQAIADPNVHHFLDRAVMTMKVMYGDWELDARIQGKRAYQMARGNGHEKPPVDFRYMSTHGAPRRDRADFGKRLLDECISMGSEVCFIDSVGLALPGNPAEFEVIIEFFDEFVADFTANGITPVLIDHQKRLQAGEKSQLLGAYGSVWKENLTRTEIQIELVGRDRERHTVTTRLRPKKTNFGELPEPVEAVTTFTADAITIERTEVTDEDRAREQTVTARERVLAALRIVEDDAGPSEVADLTELSRDTVRNVFTKLRQEGLVEDSGQMEGKAHKVRLLSRKAPQDSDRHRHSTYSSDGDDDGALITTAEQAAEVLEWLKSVPWIALDIETQGKTKAERLFYTKATPRLLTLHFGDQTYFVDLGAIETEIVAQMLRAIEEKPKYLHNALFDLPRLYRHTGVLLKERVVDTMIASRVARAGERIEEGKSEIVEHGLEHVIKRELGWEIPKDKKLKWEGELTAEHLKYAADDVLHLHAAFDALKDCMLKNNTWGRYEEISATLPTFIEAAVRGVPIDAEELRSLSEAAAEAAAALKTGIDEIAPENPNGEEWSWGNTHKPDHTDKFGNKTGRNGALRALLEVGVKLPNLEDQTLVDHRDDHPMVALLQKYKKAAREHSRYRNWLTNLYEDGRIFPQPKVAGAVTGRLLYSDPNIQGIEKNKDTELRYRKTIRAPEGFSIVAGDFAQQELRIAAHFSKDEAMLASFESGDFYTSVASKMVGHPIDKATPEGKVARAGAKRATLGFLYGLGEETYAENTYKDYGIKLSEKEAKGAQKTFRRTFPGFYKWQQRYGNLRDWETRSELGWRRVVGPRKNRDGETVPAYTERLNGPIQSTAGDVLYLALRKMQADPMEDVHFLVGVHDEVVLEAPTDRAEEAARWLKSKMQEAFEEVLGPELGGPGSVEVGYGPSWGEQTELEG